MLWKLKYVFPPERHIRLMIRGNLTSVSFHAMILDLVSNELWKPGNSVLLDYRTIDFAAATNYPLMLTMCDFVVRYNEKLGSARIALLVNSVADFGCGRQLELLTVNRASSEIRAFREEENALRWLLE